MYTFDSDETQDAEENEMNVNHLEDLENSSAPMHTQGREHGKWVVNVIGILKTVISRNNNRK